MTIEYVRTGNTTRRPAFVACPKCEAPMDPGDHWPRHWLTECPENPDRGIDDD